MQNVDMSLDLTKKDSFVKFIFVGFMLFITGDIFARGRALQLLPLQVQKKKMQSSLKCQLMKTIGYHGFTIHILAHGVDTGCIPMATSTVTYLA